MTLLFMDSFERKTTTELKWSRQQQRQIIRCDSIGCCKKVRRGKRCRFCASHRCFTHLVELQFCNYIGPAHPKSKKVGYRRRTKVRP